MYKLLELLEIDLLAIFKRTNLGCVYGEEETPVPIPNTEVKLFSGDDTAALAVGK